LLDFKSSLSQGSAREGGAAHLFPDRAGTESLWQWIEKSHSVAAL